MRWASTVSENDDFRAAVSTAVAQLAIELDDRPADLVLAFVSGYPNAVVRELPAMIAPHVGDQTVLIGCSTGGVVGGGVETGAVPAVSLTAAVLPGVDLVAFHLESSDIPVPPSAPLEWERALGVAPGSSAAEAFLLIPEPFSFALDTFLEGVDRTYPDTVKFGGLASGGAEPGENLLILGGELHETGMVGIAFGGDVRVETVVAQGCKPIGTPMFVTETRGPLLVGLDGGRPIEVLKDLFAALDERDRGLFRHSLFLGVVMREQSEAYRQGDFLVRNLLGIDGDTGGIAVGADLDRGAIVQFHLRDARTSAIDLETMLTQSRVTSRDAPPVGALMFSCLGRGEGLYGKPNYDSDVIRSVFGPLPLGGFFCNGEIGPVHGTTFLHGYTSAIALFRPRSGKP